MYTNSVFLLRYSFLEKFTYKFKYEERILTSEICSPQKAVNMMMMLAWDPPSSSVANETVETL